MSDHNFSQSSVRTKAHNFQDLTGQRFGAYIVLSLAPQRPEFTTYWYCQCDCGTLKAVRAGHLKNGSIISCGCVTKERIRRLNQTHGKSNESIYHIWCGIRQRTGNKQSPAFDRYGERGITLCLRWHTFENFLNDMGEPPSRLHSIDRTNNDWGYWCGQCDECRELQHKPNCKWATPCEQANNTRKNHFISYQGETLTVAQWARKLNLGHSRILRDRLRRGWDTESALTAPVKTTATLTFNNQTLTVEEWAKILNIPRSTLANRLRKQWSIEKTLTTPLQRNQFG